MNFKGIYLIFLNRLKEMFLSLQELTYNHSVPSNPCPIQPRSPLQGKKQDTVPSNDISLSWKIQYHIFSRIDSMIELFRSKFFI
jgi:hypothetical protein